MPLKSRPIYIIEPDRQWRCGGEGFVPYYYKEELKEIGD